MVAGYSFPVPSGSNIIQAIGTSQIPSSSRTWNTIVNILFSFLVYLTSIPVAMIIVQLNLVSSKLCSKCTSLLQVTLISIAVASFWAVTVPFLMVIPMMTGTWNDRFRTFMGTTYHV